MHPRRLAPPTSADLLPLKLAAYLLARLTDLEVRATRLAQRAEANGDLQIALTATSLSFKILTAAATLAAQAPSAAQVWQAPSLNQSEIPTVPPTTGVRLHEHSPAPDQPSPPAPALSQETIALGDHPAQEKPPTQVPDTPLRPVNADWYR